MSDITFEHFCSLVYRLGHPPKPRGTSKFSASRDRAHFAPHQIFASWLNSSPTPYALGTGKQIFRLLYPYEGSRRRYGLKETRLARELGKILCLQGLERWDSVRWDGGGEGGTGCLGREVELMMKARIPSGTRSSFTIRELDALLDMLAAPSAWSQLSQQPSSDLSPSQILIKLYRDAGLSSFAMSVLTQIILQDLRPLLNPLPALTIRNPTAMLAITSTSGPGQLELLSAMRTWDGKMAELYRGGKGSVDWCADMVDTLGGGPGGVCRAEVVPAGPVVGVNVQIPKCEKGRSVESALNEFCGNHYAPAASVVWAETKYDGYRMQIHVEIQNGQPIITIFSKSKRNATIDRGNAHSIILASLGLPAKSGLPRHPALAERAQTEGPEMQRSVILEAEVIPYNESERDGERGPGIEEFWWLDNAGIVAEDAPGFSPTRKADSHRHLCIAYFDILHLNGTSLLKTPHGQRRTLLESVIRPIDGFSLLARRTPIPLHLGRASALSILRKAFSDACARGEEGLVLKSAESIYNGSSTHRWVKLKKDYIPNLGDCIDLVLLGAGWDVDRARELRVDTSVYTTWYMGVLVNGDKVRKRQEGPHFEVTTRVSYGSSRQELEGWNSNIRLGRWGTKPFDKDDPYKKRLLGLSWTYFMPKSMIPPSVLFEQPMCAEVMGGGFQKLLGSNMYEVRWPRLQKIYDTRERPWSEALDAASLIQTAHTSLGYLPSTSQSRPTQPTSSPEDSLSVLWRTASSNAIDVIPDTPSPAKSPNRPRTVKRVKSAPDLGEILKFSPPTPRHVRRDGQVVGVSPLRTSASPGQGQNRTDQAPGQRMRDALAGHEAAGTSRPGRTGGTGGREGLGEPLLLPTPLSSPAKRLGAPLFTPSPEKRRNRSRTPTRHYGNLMQMSQYLQTPPPTSPVLSSLEMNGRIPGIPLDRDLAVAEVLDEKDMSKEDKGAAAEVGQVPVLASSPKGKDKEGKMKWRKGKAMSLRSRIKMAFRGFM